MNPAAWRIREIAADFTLADVWDLPVQGDAEDFQALVDLIHLAWVYQGDGRYQGRLAIYVKPRRLLGAGSLG